MSERDAFPPLPQGYVPIEWREYTELKARPTQKEVFARSQQAFSMMSKQLEKRITEEVRQKYIVLMIVIPIITAVLGFFLGRSF